MDCPSFPLKRISERFWELKHDMAPFNEDVMDDAFVLKLSDILVKKYRYKSAPIKQLLKLYSHGGAFGRKDRSTLSGRIAYYHQELIDGNYIGRWGGAFVQDEWLAVRIVSVQPEIDPATGVVKVLAYMYVHAGASAGHIISRTFSMGMCSRLAYLIGYSMFNKYDSENPRNLMFLQFSIQTKAGSDLQIGQTFVNTLQHSQNLISIKCRSGKCPLELGIACADCSRKFGPFSPEGVTCEGGIFQ